MEGTEPLTDAEEREPDGDLLAEADRLGFSDEERRVWFAASGRQRGLIKARRHRDLKARARTLGLNPERFLNMTPEQRDAATTEAVARIEQRRAEVFEKHLAKPPGAPPSPEAPPTVYTASADVPATDGDARRRAGITVGPVVERVDDLAGDRPPRTLADIYARWPMLGRPGGDQFALRVERIWPKSFGGVACAGYLGEIRGIVVNEEQFGRYFGGREYHVTLYGPDPRGRCDANGDVIIKALTDPVQVTVTYPNVNPNLRYLPSAKPQKNERAAMAQSQVDPFNPFASAFPAGGQGAPTTSADASIFKTSVDFVREVLQDNQKRGKDDGDGNPPKHVLEFVARTAESQTEQARRAADSQERMLRDQLDGLRKDLERKQETVEALGKEIATMKSNGSGQITEILKLKDTDLGRIHENHRLEMANLREHHEQHVKMMGERHAGELRRLEERIKEQESNHREALDSERRRRDEEEKRLKAERDEVEKRMQEEVRRVREEERKDAERRVGEANARAKERRDDQETAHQRQLAIEKSNAEVKVTTEVAKMTFELNHLRERLAEKEKQLDEAKSELEDSKDPSAVMAKWEAEAKKLGFRKKDDEEPKTFWQQLGANAGQGLGQAIGGMDLTALVGALAGAAAGKAGVRQQQQQRQVQGTQRPALPAAQVAAHQRAAQAGHSGRAARWASQGAPIAREHETYPASPVGEPPAVPAPPPPVAPMVAPPVAQPIQPSAPAEAPPQEQSQQPAAEQRAIPPLPPHRMLQTFGPEATMGFLHSVEGAINQAMKPDRFAELFFGQYGDAAGLLAAQFGPNDARSFVEAMTTQYPDALGSPILTKAGQEWLQKMWDRLKTLASGAQPQPQA